MMQDLPPPYPGLPGQDDLNQVDANGNGPNPLPELLDQEHQHFLDQHPDFLQLPAGVFPIDDIDPSDIEEEEGEMAIW